MEDSKNIHKCHGNSGEDFHLWAARTEAALQAKEILYVIESDVIAVPPPNMEVADLGKDVSKAATALIRGLGERPLRLCLSDTVMSSSADKH